MIRAAALAVALAAAALVSSARAAETPIPASPTGWVTDTAGVLSPSTRASLDSQLSDYARSSGHQVIVWIGQTTGDAPLEDWTIRAFTKWKVGRKGLDDGCALFLFMQDHKIRIEVGYGLEGKLTDATTSHIARNLIAPRLKAGDVDGAVTAGVQALLATISGTPISQAAQPEAAQNPQVTPGTVIDFAVVLIVIIFFIFAISRSAMMASRGAYTIGSRGGYRGYTPVMWGGFGGGNGGSFGGGGFSGGGGGFSGGGGMGGGGGASASW